MFLSFSIMAQNSNELMGLTKIQTGVKSKRVSSYDKSGGNNDRVEKIAPGQTLTLCDIKGTGIINHIWITIAPPPSSLDRNNIILKMYWDGNKKPSVNSPIGPFFGQGWNESYDYASLPLAAGPKEGRALVSYFAMPFEKGAKIEITNENNDTIKAFYYYVDYVEMVTLPEGTGRFHAWYNNQTTECLPEGENEWGLLNSIKNIENGSNLKGERNYLFLETKGKGHFVGVNYYVHSPGPMWYGEGDDMFFIDGEDEPSLNGTGTEDYFNTAWCPKDKYAHPYYGYARVNNDVGWLGRTHVYRFHITDPIYFDKSLKFSIEHGHNNALTLNLASVAYWYQDKAVAVPEIAGKEQRKPKSFNGVRQMQLWRHYWREANGSDLNAW